MKGRLLALAVALAGCGAHPGPADVVRARVSSARAAADMRALLDTPVVDGGLWFRDPDCRQRFAAPGPIGPDRIDAFARCLVTLHLRASPRRSRLDDVSVYVDDAGFELEAQVGVAEPHRIRWIGYAERQGPRDALPSISAEALQRLGGGGSLEPILDPAAHAELARMRQQWTNLAYSSAWIKVCVDARGAVTSAHARWVTSPVAARVFTAAVRAWRFSPFVVDGQALPVCAMVQVADPPRSLPSGLAAVLPLPLPTGVDAMYVSPATLRRRSGTIEVPPSEDDMVAMSGQHPATLEAVFALCMDADGTVTSVRRVHPSTRASWDARIAAVLRGWRYEPFVVDGTPQPACTTIKFTYTQR